MEGLVETERVDNEAVGTPHSQKGPLASELQYAEDDSYGERFCQKGFAYENLKAEIYSNVNSDTIDNEIMRFRSASY